LTSTMNRIVYSPSGCENWARWFYSHDERALAKSTWHERQAVLRSQVPQLHWVA
jgi:hypothetical protein